MKLSCLLFLAFIIGLAGLTYNPIFSCLSLFFALPISFYLISTLEFNVFKISFWWFFLLEGIQLIWFLNLIDTPTVFSFLLWLFLTSWTALQFALVALLFRRDQLSFFRVLFISASFCLLEWHRLFSICGFGMQWMGQQLHFPFFARTIVPVFGVLGLTFFLFFTLLLWIKQRPFYQQVLPFVVILGCSLIPKQEEYLGDLKVGIMHTHLAPDDKRQLGAFEEWKRMLALLPLESNVDLVILPEIALTGGADKKVLTKEEVRTLFAPIFDFRGPKIRYSNLDLLKLTSKLYAFDLIVGLNHDEEESSYNSAFLISKGEIKGRYDKQHLVAITEYFPSFCPDFVKDIFGIYDFFDEGKGATILEGRFRFAPTICFDEYFGASCADFKQLGGDVFINLSNDIWFPGSYFKHQHLMHSRLRALENGMTVIRSSNGGISGWISPNGNIEVKIDELSSHYQELVIPIKKIDTIYGVFADWPIVLFSLLIIVSNLLIEKSCYKMNFRIRKKKG